VQCHWIKFIIYIVYLYAKELLLDKTEMHSNQHNRKIRLQEVFDNRHDKLAISI